MSINEFKMRCCELESTGVVETGELIVCLNLNTVIHLLLNTKSLLHESQSPTLPTARRESCIYVGVWWLVVVSINSCHVVVGPIVVVAN